MKLEAYGILAASLGIGAADALSSPAAVQYGALAILAGLVYSLIRYSFPSLLKAQKEERDAFLSAQKEEREASLAAQKEEREASQKTEEATRQDFRGALTEISQSVDCLAAAISEARQSAGP